MSAKHICMECGIEFVGIDCPASVWDLLCSKPCMRARKQWEAMQQEILNRKTTTKQGVSEMNRFTAESCHDVGYGWEIDAPTEITADEIEALIDMTINYDDQPSQSIFFDALNDVDYTDYPDLKPERVDLYRQVMISVECVHRAAFSQSIEQVTEE